MKSTHRPLLRPSRRRTRPSTALLSIILLAGLAPVLEAAPGGGKGKPGGGGEDPPPPPPPPVDATYTAAQVPVPPWASLYSVKNINNAGNAVGNAGERRRGRNQLTEGFVWTLGDAAPRALPPIPGWGASEAYDLTDDGTIVVGASWAHGTPSIYDRAAPTAWVLDGGTYHTVNLDPPLLAGAAAFLPEYDITFFDADVAYFWGTIVSSDGRFTRLIAFVGEGAWFYPGAFNNMDVVVEWDWTNPLQPRVTGMWPLVSPPKPNPVTPEDNGYIIPVPDTLELGVCSLDDPSPVLRVTSTIWYWDPELGELDWDTTNYSPAVVWELDVTSRTPALRILEVPPGGLTRAFSGTSVNALGEVVDVPYLWDGDGNLTNIVAQASVINTLREGVGPRIIGGSYFGPDLGDSSHGPAYHWDANTGVVTDLNTVVAGGLGLNRAYFVNEASQILAAGPGGWYVLTPIE